MFNTLTNKQPNNNTMAALEGIFQEALGHWCSHSHRTADFGVMETLPDAQMTTIFLGGGRPSKAPEAGQAPL